MVSTHAWATFRLAICLGTLSLSAGAAAQGDESGQSDRARALYDQGSQAFSVGDYGRAADLFQEAYDLSERPELLFNIYSALEREGTRLPEAADALERYLASGEVEEPRYAQLSARLARLRSRIASEAEAERAREVDEVAGQEPVINPPVEEEEASGGVHPAATALLIAGGAFAVSFAVFAGLSAAEDSSLEDSCGSGNPAIVCSDDEIGTLRTYNTVADISLIAAGVTAVSGLVLLFVLKDSPDERAASVRLSPWITPETGGASLGGQF